VRFDPPAGTAVTEQITELAETGCLLVVIDPLHMVLAHRDLPYENREREVSEIIRRLKALALDLDIAIVVTSHLTNNPGPRQSIPGRPSLADLRDSGVIAHVADMVILIHRPDMGDVDDFRGGEVDLIVAKHRTGPAFTCTVAHQLHLSRLVDIVRS
jgi:replicative DNA helicase